MPPSERVLTIESEIIAAEGYAHVGGRYFASDDDADRQRRWEAERRAEREVREAQLREVDAAIASGKSCVQCDMPFGRGLAFAVPAMSKPDTCTECANLRHFALEDFEPDAGESA